MPSADPKSSGKLIVAWLDAPELCRKNTPPLLTLIVAGPVSVVFAPPTVSEFTVAAAVMLPRAESWRFEVVTPDGAVVINSDGASSRTSPAAPTVTGRPLALVR